MNRDEALLALLADLRAQIQALAVSMQEKDEEIVSLSAQLTAAQNATSD